MFQCFPSSPQTVTYHAELHGTMQANVSQLLAFLQEWTSSVDTIAVQVLPLSVQSFCAVDSRVPQEQCTDVLATNTLPTDSGSSGIIAASASVAAAVTVCVIIIAVVVIMVTRCSRRHSSLDLTKRENSLQ